MSNLKGIKYVSSLNQEARNVIDLSITRKSFQDFLHRYIHKKYCLTNLKIIQYKTILNKFPSLVISFVSFVLIYLPGFFCVFTFVLYVRWYDVHFTVHCTPILIHFIWENRPFFIQIMMPWCHKQQKKNYFQIKREKKTEKRSKV